MTSAALLSLHSPFHLPQFLLRFAFHFQHRLRRIGFKIQTVHTIGNLFFDEEEFRQISQGNFIVAMDAQTYYISIRKRRPRQKGQGQVILIKVRNVTPPN